MTEAFGDQPFLAVSLLDDEINRIKTMATNLTPHWEHPTQVSHLYYERALIDLSLIALKDHADSRQIPLHRHASERVERAIAWYVVNMARNPTVDEVALALHMSPTHLRRLFKEVKNQSPHKVFRELKIKRATELLGNTLETIEEIASRCGFQSTTDFSRVFRLEMEVSPNRWRRETVPEEP